MPKNALFMLISVVVGLASLGLGVWQYFTVTAFITKALRTTATYVDNILQTSPSPKFDATSSHRRYQFTTPDGRTFGCTSIVGGLPTKPGSQTIEVLYDPADPSQARINSWIELYGVPAIFIALGVGTLVVGPLILLVVSNWK